jgi:hypothetical protein
MIAVVRRMKTIHIECANEINPNELHYISNIFGSLVYKSDKMGKGSKDGDE